MRQKPPPALTRKPAGIDTECPSNSNAPQIREGDEASFLSHPGRIVDKEKDAGGGFCVKSPLPPPPENRLGSIQNAHPTAMRPR